MNTRALAATLAVAFTPAVFAAAPPMGAALPLDPLAVQPLGTENPEFRLDAKGDVFYLDRRIVKNGRRTNFSPDDENARFLVAPSGAVVYEDSYGKLRKNGSKLNANFHRAGDFEIDDSGSVYWVKDHSGQEIYKDGAATGYEIKDGSPFWVSPAGQVQWISEDGVLHLDDQPQNILLRPGSFVRDAGGRFYYVVQSGGSRFRLLRFDPSTGEQKFLSILVRRDFLRAGRHGTVWHLDHTGTLHKNGKATHFQATDFRVDGKGRVFRLWEGTLHKGGHELGFEPVGYWDVSLRGSVVYVGDSSSKNLYRDGRRLGFGLK